MMGSRASGRWIGGARRPFRDVSLTVAAAGFFANRRPGYAAARGEIRRQRRADRDHAAVDRRGGRRDASGASAPGGRAAACAESRSAQADRPERRRRWPASTISPGIPSSTPARRCCSARPTAAAAAGQLRNRRQISRLTACRRPPPPPSATRPPSCRRCAAPSSMTATAWWPTC